MTFDDTLLGRVLAQIADSAPEQHARVSSFVQLLTLSGVQIDLQTATRFSSSDWRSVAEIAHKQGFLPLFHDRLLEALSSASQWEGLAVRLITERIQCVQRNLALTAETIRLVSAFEKEGVRVIPFKGCVLSAAAYGNLALRRPGDIDLLVQPSDVQKAAALLARLTYTSLHTRGPAWQAGHLGYDCEWEFYSRARHMAVDLHWNFTARNFGLSFPVGQIWDRTQRVLFSGCSAESFSPEDLILVLSVHAVKHYCRQLEWIFTIAALLKKMPKFSWDDLFQMAKQYGALRHISIALMLADELYDAPLPDSVRARILEDKAAERLAMRSLQWVLTGQCADLSDVEQRFFISETRIGLISKLRYWWAVIWTPNEKDFRWELPRWLWWSYPILRSGRLLGELVGIGRKEINAEGKLPKTGVLNSAQ